MVDQSNRRTAVVTGASSGIGKVTAKALAAAGWHVIAHGRDPVHTAEAEAQIQAAARQGARIDMIRGDLALLADAARMAEEIRKLTGEVHALVNNAGGVRSERIVTAEGNEVTFAGNHLGHFLLTNRLLPLLRAAAARSEPGTVRVLAVSSSAHEHCPGLNWSDLQHIGQWVSAPAYCSAKLCNVLFIRELARRVAADGIVANAMHPGIVATNFASHGDAAMKSYFETVQASSAEEAADTLIWLATAPEVGKVTGEYFYNRAAVKPAAQALDDEAAARLWKESEALVGRAGMALTAEASRG